MKHLLPALVLLCTGFTVAAQQKKVILISIDGFRADFYRNSEWPAPHLQQLATQGTQATGVQSVFPSLTYPSHTSITTGALPLHHGIYFNNVFEGKEGEGIWNHSNIKVPTLWQALHQAGLKSAAVMWPVTVGAPIDYNFPVRRADEDEQSDQITMTRPFVTPAGFLDEFEKVHGKINPEDFKSHVHAQDSVVTDMALYMLKTYQPSLTAFHLLSMDHTQHEVGREGAAVKESLAIIDGLIGKVVNQLKAWGMDKTTDVIITGDHGFVTTTTVFAPNVLLAQHGLIQGKQWKAKFAPAGGSAFLYVKNNDVQVLQQVKEILEALPQEQRSLFRIINRTQLDNAGANTDAMMALALTKGVKANAKTTGALVQPAKKGGNHGYFPDFPEIQTGFIAIGPDIQTGQTITEIGVKDMAPLISAILQVPFHAPDGTLVKGILQ